MAFASIQRINSIEKHPNADSLSICTVLNYRCITKLNQYKEGDLIIFIEPDSVLPVAQWAEFYKSKSNRVKAIKLRGEWSFGIIESIDNVGYKGLIQEELDITDVIGVIKYEAPAPQDLQASGPYLFGIPKTDKERWNGINDLPFGQLCDITLKIDGQSWSAICANTFDLDNIDNNTLAVGGRSFLYKLDSVNNYTNNEKKYNVFNKLKAFCDKEKVSLCLRGEQFGAGIQKYGINPHAKHPLSLAFYSTWMVRERRYARKNDPYYIFNIASELGLSTVPVVEQNVVLTKELIMKYSEALTEINGQPFEGVVVNWAGGSFKIINMYYDSKK